MFVSYIVLVFLICHCVLYTSQETVKVSIYYETLCPYSIDFLTHGLYPAYNLLGDSLNINLIPHGKAKQSKADGKWKLKCQHGPKECHANLIQGCVIGQNYTQEQTINFVECLMQTGNPERNPNARKCAEKYKLSWDVIKTCTYGKEGIELFVHFGNITDSLNPPLEYVPHILFNDKFNKTMEESARDDFTKTVCDLFKVKPEGCDIHDMVDFISSLSINY